MGLHLAGTWSPVVLLRVQFQGQLLSNVFVTDLDAGVEHTISKFANYTRCEGAVERCSAEGSG